MDASALYTLATSGWLALQAVPLLFTPTVLLPLLTSDEGRIPELAVYLSRTLALTLLALSGQGLLLSGIIPLSGDASATSTAFLPSSTVLTTLFHFGTAFLQYTTYISGVGGTPASGGTNTIYGLAMAVSATLGAAGVWCALFGTGSGHISRRTGKDKRTSGWPFGDKKGRLADKEL